MSAAFKGTISVDELDSEPDWGPFEAPRMPDGAQTAVHVVLDDVGFGSMRCYGGPIQTPRSTVSRPRVRGRQARVNQKVADSGPARNCRGPWTGCRPDGPVDRTATVLDVAVTAQATHDQPGGFSDDRL